jgi:hypothetical protein
VTSKQRSWNLPDYALPATSDWDAPTVMPAQPARQVVHAHRRREINRASARVVYVLMMATSVMALVDLYLLSTAIPH